MRSRMPLLKKLAAQGLLALAFFYAQNAAALHWLSHAIEATQAQAGKGSPPGDHCDECLTLSALGAGATSQAFTLPAPAAQHALQPILRTSSGSATTALAFRSRAPPVLT